jgi:hypothetical protein
MSHTIVSGHALNTNDSTLTVRPLTAHPYRWLNKIDHKGDSVQIVDFLRATLPSGTLDRVALLLFNGLADDLVNIDSFPREVASAVQGAAKKRILGEDTNEEV